MSSQLSTQSIHSNEQMINISINKRLVSVSKSLLLRFMPKLIDNKTDDKNIELNDCDFDSFNLLINEIEEMFFNANNFIDSLIKSIEISIELNCVLITQLMVNNCIDLINIRNVLQIYSNVLNSNYNNNNYQKLIEECLEFIDLNALEVMDSNEWNLISDQLLISLITRQTFYSPEIDIFIAINRWLEFNHKVIDEKIQVLSYIRLELITERQYHQIMKPKKLVSEKDFKIALKMREKLQENDSLEERAQILDHKMKNSNSFKLIGISKPIQTSNSRSDGITVSAEAGKLCPITIDLKYRFKINYICFTLSKFFNDRRRYSYFISGSIDGIKWKTIVDYQDYVCAMNQLISFRPIVVRFISIQSTKESVNKFPVINFDCGFSDDCVLWTKSGTLIYNRLVFPNNFSYCVSVFKRSYETRRVYSSPFVISDRKPLLHHIGSGRVAITFNQPMFIQVIQFYLWNYDNRGYSYYIQISKNLKDWELIQDFTQELRSGLQRIDISRNVISIRIVGTYVYPNSTIDTNHGDQEFRIIHLDFLQLDD